MDRLAAALALIPRLRIQGRTTHNRELIARVLATRATNWEGRIPQASPEGPTTTGGRKLIGIIYPRIQAYASGDVWVAMTASDTSFWPDATRAACIRKTGEEAVQALAHHLGVVVPADTLASFEEARQQDDETT